MQIKSQNKQAFEEGRNQAKKLAMRTIFTDFDYSGAIRIIKTICCPKSEQFHTFRPQHLIIKA